MHLFTLSVAAVLCSFVDAHMSMGFPVPRASPKNPNSPFVDFECILAPLTAGPACRAKPFPCGYQRDTRITQTLKAGQIIDVEFFNTNFPNGAQNGDESRDQARHSGGLCEFSLSVDDGKSFHVIASYTRGCPDIFFKFPVRIPDDVPSSDSAIFAWTWINASGNREFYMNCADVKLVGVPGGKLNGPDITKANLPGVSGFEKTLTPTADVNPLSNTKGPGPSTAEVQKNRGGAGSGNGNNNTPVSSPVVRPPSPSGGNSKSIALAKELESKKKSNIVGQACTSRSIVCIGSDIYGFCDNGKIVLGGSCAQLKLSCFNVPMVDKEGTTVTCMSQTEFEQRIASGGSGSGNNANGSLPPSLPEKSLSPSPATSPVSTGSFQRDNGVLAKSLEETKSQNVANQPCETGSIPICLGDSGVGLCGNGKILATAPCGNGLKCFNLPLVNRPGVSATCTTQEDFDSRIATALAS